MTDLVDDIFGRIFHQPVRRKANRTGNLRQIASRVSRNAPEVMVKITGFARGESHIRSHFSYISRHNNVELETDNEEILRSKEDVQEYLDDWMEDINSLPRRKNQRDVMRLMLSMPPNVSEDDVKDATRRFAQETFGGRYEYVFALHTDTTHPHCHVTVRTRGQNGYALDPKKADLQEWRERFADKLIELGVNASATPRRSRGVTRKPKKSVIHHIEKGDKTHATRTSKIKAIRVREVAKKLVMENSGVPPPDEPWEEAVKKRQEEIKSAWSQAAEMLEKSCDSADRELAAQIRDFTAAMPLAETENQRVRKELIQKFTRQADKIPEPEKTGDVLERKKEKDREKRMDFSVRKKQSRDLER